MLGHCFKFLRIAKYKPSCLSFGWQANEAKTLPLNNLLIEKQINEELSTRWSASNNILFFQLYLKSSIWKLLRGWHHLCVDWQVYSLTLSLIIVCLLHFGLGCKQFFFNFFFLHTNSKVTESEADHARELGNEIWDVSWHANYFYHQLYMAESVRGEKESSDWLAEWPKFCIWIDRLFTN